LLLAGQNSARAAWNAAKRKRRWWWWK
jgi:hypothetical protein